MRNQMFMAFNIHIVILRVTTPFNLEAVNSVLKMGATEVMSV
jgi:hypothetical protein